MGFTCFYCHRTCATHQSHKRHRTFCKSKNQPYVCRQCKKTFACSSDRITHEGSHKPFRCELCDKPYVLQACLRQHQMKCGGCPVICLRNKLLENDKDMFLCKFNLKIVQGRSPRLKDLKATLSFN